MAWHSVVGVAKYLPQHGNLASTNADIARIANKVESPNETLSVSSTRDSESSDRCESAATCTANDAVSGTVP
jgi:hypothetical protein